MLDLLFKKTVKEKSKTELILLITPRVLTTPEEGAQRTRQRMTALSDHPYPKQGARALQKHFDEFRDTADAQSVPAEAFAP